MRNVSRGEWVSVGTTLRMAYTHTFQRTSIELGLALGGVPSDGGSSGSGGLGGGDDDVDNEIAEACEGD